MILALETSTRRASLAVYDRDAGRVVDEASFVTDRAHNAAIFEPLVRLAGIHRNAIEACVVGLGPGSYGGVRVGLAVAQGLSLAWGVPVAGASSLEAWETEADSYLVAGDARRGSVFVAVVRGRILQGEPELVELAALAEALAPGLGEGLAVHTPDATVAAAWPDAILSHPSAARLAARFRTVDLAAQAPPPLEPVYLRAPYITTPRKR